MAEIPETTRLNPTAALLQCVLLLSAGKGAPPCRGGVYQQCAAVAWGSGSSRRGEQAGHIYSRQVQHPPWLPGRATCPGASRMCPATVQRSSHGLLCCLAPMPGNPTRSEAAAAAAAGCVSGWWCRCRVQQGGPGCAHMGSSGCATWRGNRGIGIPVRATQGSCQQGTP
jgi:hypothetical protein